MDGLAFVASLVQARGDDRLLAIAVDGGDAAGKTTFANQLAELVQSDRPVIRVQSDHFEHPRSIRYRRGAASPEGYLDDTYDDDALVGLLLGPFRLGGPVVTGLIDWHTDQPLNLAPQSVEDRAVLIVDGCFLLRERLRDLFDIGVFLDVSPEVRLERAIPRQAAHFRSQDELVERFRTRYLPGFELYLERDRPADHADVVIDNHDFEHPMLVKPHVDDRS